MLACALPRANGLGVYSMFQEAVGPGRDSRANLATWSTLAQQKAGKERALAPSKNKGEDTNPAQSSVQPLLRSDS